MVAAGAMIGVSAVSPVPTRLACGCAPYRRPSGTAATRRAYEYGCDTVACTGLPHETYFEAIGRSTHHPDRTTIGSAHVSHRVAHSNVHLSIEVQVAKRCDTTSKLAQVAQTACEASLRARMMRLAWLSISSPCCVGAVRCRCSAVAAYRARPYLPKGRYGERVGNGQPAQDEHDATPNHLEWLSPMAVRRKHTYDGSPHSAEFVLA